MIKTRVCIFCGKRKKFAQLMPGRNSKYGYQKRCTTCHVNIVNFGGKRETVLKRDSYSCVKCGMTDKEHRKRWKRSITVDHIDGNGTYVKIKNNDLNNLQTLCLSCHSTKDNNMRFERNKNKPYVYIAKKGEKLVPKQVLSIRHLSKEGMKSPQLAKRFNVSYQTIWSIVNFKK